MKVNLPHSHGKAEVRRRLRERAHEIAGFFPAGTATVETNWPEEDRMDLTVTAMGQRVAGGVEIFDDEVAIELDLPAMLGFLRGTIEAAVRRNGTKLLE